MQERRRDEGEKRGSLSFSFYEAAVCQAPWFFHSFGHTSGGAGSSEPRSRRRRHCTSSVYRKPRPTGTGVAGGPVGVEPMPDDLLSVATYVAHQLQPCAGPGGAPLHLYRRSPEEPGEGASGAHQRVPARRGAAIPLTPWLSPWRPRSPRPGRHTATARPSVCARAPQSRCDAPARPRRRTGA